jgi:hypothetical protein
MVDHDCKLIFQTRQRRYIFLFSLVQYSVVYSCTTHYFHYNNTRCLYSCKRPYYNRSTVYRITVSTIYIIISNMYVRAQRRIVYNRLEFIFQNVADCQRLSSSSSETATCHHTIIPTYIYNNNIIIYYNNIFHGQRRIYYLFIHYLSAPARRVPLTKMRFTSSM